MMGDAGVVGRESRDGDAAGAGEETPLKPARMAGMGVLMAIANDGGGEK